MYMSNLCEHLTSFVWLDPSHLLILLFPTPTHFLQCLCRELFVNPGQYILAKGDDKAAASIFIVVQRVQLMRTGNDTWHAIHMDVYTEESGKMGGKCVVKSVTIKCGYSIEEVFGKNVVWFKGWVSHEEDSERISFTGQLARCKTSVTAAAYHEACKK